MKKGLILLALMSLAGGTAYAASIERGKALFESPQLGGGTTGNSCMTCHAGGKGLGPDLFSPPPPAGSGQSADNLPDIINSCIVKTLGGTPIDRKGEEMGDLIAYIRTLVFGGESK